MTPKPPHQDPPPDAGLGRALGRVIWYFGVKQFAALHLRVMLGFPNYAKIDEAKSLLMACAASAVFAALTVLQVRLGQPVSGPEEFAIWALAFGPILLVTLIKALWQIPNAFACVLLVCCAIVDWGNLAVYTFAVPLDLVSWYSALYKVGYGVLCWWIWERRN